jgi:hypothetical protein
MRGVEVSGTPHGAESRQVDVTKAPGDPGPPAEAESGVDEDEAGYGHGV